MMFRQVSPNTVLLSTVVWITLASTLFPFALSAQPNSTPESHLLLPYFEVSLEGEEQTTFLSLVSSGEGNLELTARIYSNWAVPLLEVGMTLASKQVRSINLRDWILRGRLPNGETVCSDGGDDCLELEHLRQALSGRPSSMTQLYYGSAVEAGLASGFMTIVADDGYLPESDVLWGDFVYTDPVDNFARGERLVRFEPDLNAGDLCQRHSIRFLNGGGISGDTKLTIWNWDGRDREPSPTQNPEFELGRSTIDVYSEQGELVEAFPQQDLLPAQTIVVSDLGLDKAVGWLDMTTSEPSSVSGFYRALGRFSVGVSSWCQPCDPCNAESLCYEPGAAQCQERPCVPARLRAGCTKGEVGQPLSFSYGVSGSSATYIDMSRLPEGLVHRGSKVSGIPTEEGSFTVTASNACGGDSVTVTIGPATSQSAGPAKVTLIARVINDDGGTATPAHFALFIGDFEVASGVTSELAPGTYKVRERIFPGYQPGPWGGDCSADGTVTLEPGQHKVCEIINDDIAPR